MVEFGEKLSGEESRERKAYIGKHEGEGKEIPRETKR